MKKKAAPTGPDGLTRYQRYEKKSREPSRKVTVRLPEDVAKRADAKALAAGVSLTGWAVDVVTKAARARGSAPQSKGQQPKRPR